MLYWEGRPVLIIDAHTHIFPPEVIARREEFLAKDAWFSHLYRRPMARMQSAEELMAALDTAGVDRAVVLGFCWGSVELAKMSNDYLLEAVHRHPRRLIAFVNAPLPWGEAALREIERGIRGGAKGIGELMPNGQGYSLDDEALVGPLVELSREHDAPLLLHASEPVGHHYAGKGSLTPEAIYRLIGRYPQAKLILAHWGGGLAFYELMPEVKEELAGVYYDTAATTYLYRDEVFLLLAPIVGHKLLFASDYPLVDQAELLGRIRGVGLPEEVLGGILGGNAQRLLGLE